MKQSLALGNRNGWRDSMKHDERDQYWLRNIFIFVLYRMLWIWFGGG